MRPTLYLFAISHYCEKARWALDYLGIDYELVYLAPGLHISTTKKLNAPASTLPILKIGNTIIQGSSNIIDWAESATTSTRKLTPPAENLADRQACAEIENRLDDVAGVHTRRMFYSEALVEHPATVRPIFTKDLALPQRLLVAAIWPKVRKKMIAGMDLGYEQGMQSQKIVDRELAWLDGMLENGRNYLVGDSLSRADITAAGLFGPLATAVENPSYKYLIIPPRLSAIVRNWRDRPSLNWIRNTYRDHR